MSFQLHPDTTLDVVHLYVSNVKKSLEFYTEVLSMKVLKEEIKTDITHILFDATGHTPIVIPVINKV